MPGFSRLDIRFLLVAILIVAGICSAHAERWQIGPESGRCPVQRLDPGNKKRPIATVGAGGNHTPFDRNSADL
jgi:hypothetical protein